MAGEFESVPLLYPVFNLIPNENPLSDSGKWGPDGDRPPLMAGSDGLSIHGSVEFVVNGSLYVEKAFVGPIKEAYACTPDPDLGAALESQRVALWTDPNARTGYSIGHGGGIGQTYFFRKYTSNAFIGIGSTPSREEHPNRLGLRITPTEVQAWGFYIGDTPEWQLISVEADSEHRGPMWCALETEEQGGLNEVSFQCFAGGVPNRTQIYRVVKGLSTGG